MSKFFSLKELIASTEAYKRKIDNTPGEEEKAHLEELIEFMDDIRSAWGSAIIVTSGYRCPELNTAVKGVSTSQHQLGVAADLDTRKGHAENQKLYDLIAKYFDFDQLLWENNGAWIHYSYVRPNRKMKANVTQC